MYVQRGKFEIQSIRWQLQRTLLGNESSCANVFVAAVTAGKSSWNLFRAQWQMFSTAREYFHRGLVVSHYSWDRGIASCLHDMVVAEADLEEHENRSLLGLLDWVIFTPCCDHDARNSLKWAVSTTLEETVEDSKRWMENLWICVEALRNGFDCILLELGPFIAAHLAFSDTDWPACTASRTFLGLQHDMVEKFIELELRFGNCLLYVHRNLEEKISVCLVHVFRFKAHSDSRFLSVGETCRTLVRSMAVGIKESCVDCAENNHVCNWPVEHVS